MLIDVGTDGGRLGGLKHVLPENAIRKVGQGSAAPGKLLLVDLLVLEAPAPPPQGHSLGRLTPRASGPAAALTRPFDPSLHSGEAMPKPKTRTLGGDFCHRK